MVATILDEQLEEHGSRLKEAVVIVTGMFILMTQKP
jgi:hypothetical protein